MKALEIGGVADTILLSLSPTLSMSKTINTDYPITTNVNLCLAREAIWRRRGMFFERTDLLSAIKHNLASGNPVRIGDGCATVTGYKLP